MSIKPTDVRPLATRVYFLPIESRMPIKFGNQILTHMTCARVRVTVADRAGHTAHGWGETPLAVEWGWPSELPYEPRHQSMRQFCVRLAAVWAHADAFGHPLELGHDFLELELPRLLAEHNRDAKLPEPMPRLAALICASTIDQAIHDAYGVLHRCPTYSTYNSQFMNRDLGHYLQADAGSQVQFAGRFPEEFLTLPRRPRLPAWHLVGGLDPLEASQIRPPAPEDGHPVALVDWIRRDGLTCLKVKLRGNDAAWDYDRLVKVGAIGQAHHVRWLSADFNCTVTDPAYVTAILDRLLAQQPAIFQMLLYVEQPFPYDLEAHPIDVRSVSARKPLLMDESAHDWKMVRLGRDRGWSGVALKTCKTLSEALLSLCWAKAHGMPLMVQDLANPMLAQVSHVQLAAHAGTIMGVETNSSQFFPAASQPEAQVHPGLYRRRGGEVDSGTIGPTGIGYRIDEIRRTLPDPAGVFDP